MIPLWYLFSYKYCYRSLSVRQGPPNRTLGCLVDKAEASEEEGLLRLMFWMALLMLGVGVYLAALPFMRMCGLPRRIKFWRALKLNHGMYYRDTVHEYEEAIKAQELMETL